MSEYINLESAGYQQRVSKRSEYSSNAIMQTSNMSKIMATEKKIQEKKEYTQDEKDMIEKLLIASKDAEISVLIALLKDNAIPNIPDSNGDYCTHISILRKDALDAMKAFFDGSYKYLANINAKNKKGQTILQLAALKCDYDLFLYLLTKGALPNIQDVDGNTVLHLLAMYDKGAEKMFEKCLDYGGDTNIPNGKNKLCSQLTSNIEIQRVIMDQKFNLNSEVMGGDIEVGLGWSNLNDLDLHCYCRCDTHIFYGQKKCENCRGFLDWDMNVDANNKDPKCTSLTPVEHIYWPRIIPGKFLLTVLFYRNHPNIETTSEYFIFMNVKGQCVYQVKGALTKEKEEVKVLCFEVDQDKNVKVLELKDMDIPTNLVHGFARYGSEMLNIAPQGTRRQPRMQQVQQQQQYQQEYSQNVPGPNESIQECNSNNLQ